MSDSLTPNYLTYDAGIIGANFTGHVHAGGLDLDASSISTPPDNDRIRWLRTSDGAWVATLFGQYVPGTPPGEAATFMLQDPDSSGARTAAISLAYNNGSSTEVDATATFGGITKVVQLINSSDGSDFLRILRDGLGHTRKLALQCGGPSGGTVGTITTITHGLGVVPKAVIVSNTWGDNTSQTDWTVYDVFAADFKVINKGPTNGQFYWVAIG